MPETPPVYDVFFSYAHYDIAAVKPIIDALHLKGFQVWFDETHIDDFESITRAIPHKLMVKHPSGATGTY